MGKKCLTISLRDSYQEERKKESAIAYTREQWRMLLYAFGRPLVPLWTDEELYKSVDKFLERMKV